MYPVYSVRDVSGCAGEPVCGLGGRVHPQLARTKLEALVVGARLASKWVS
jgi:hypothetical protein